MKTNAGKFDIPITINKPTETNINGEMVTTWSLHYNTCAMRKPITNGEKEEVEAMALVSQDYTEFMIRVPLHKSHPTTKMKVIESGIEYDIENVRPEGRNQYLILRCKQKQQR